MNNIIEVRTEYENFVKQSIQPVIVFIIVNWLGTCQLMSPVFEKMAIQYKDKFKFILIDIDSVDERIKNRFDKLPVILFYKNGDLVDQLKGAVSSIELENKIKTLLGNL